MVTMKKLLICAAAVLSVSMQAFAQAPAKSSATPTAPKKITTTTPAADSAGVGPSIPVVDAFLKRMFGYNENLAFHVSNVKPTDAPGISEVTAVVNTPQGQQALRFFVTSDGQHAIMG